MPKLSAKQSKSVAAQEEREDFALIPDDLYTVRLRDVKVSEQDGPSGFPYWTWELEIVDGEFANRRLWNTTSLSPQAEFALAAAFRAFGYSPDSDTDEMLGEMCTASVGHRIIEKGAKKGEQANTVDALLPFKGDDADAEEPF